MDESKTDRKTPAIVRSRFTGFADTYDRYRPRPPMAIVTLLLEIIGDSHAGTVVDLGCGTGLSTVIWDGSADAVVGIEPNDDMRERATAGSARPGIRYVKATSYETDLDAESVDIVTCSQSFHWMEPRATLDECARILRPGGVFAAYDNDWPPFVSPACDRAYAELLAQVRRLTTAHRDSLPQEQSRDKRGHLTHIRESGLFAWSRELVLHNTEACDADRFVNMAMSQGSLQTLLKNGISAIDEHIERYVEAVNTDFARSASRTMWTSYRVRCGAKS
ncbi:MAG: methyltransferase domain-containing protein [Chitinivibrionales bacterium]|nr:methyltransferase domain-containing protein [Chitinivibrionales bacterium]